MNFREHTTATGLRVLVESNPSALSAAVGFFVGTGSRDETPEIEGVSHFLEHMSFKATKKRSALDISRTLDEMGSRANAYTSWERTVYYAQVLPDCARDAVELLAEMIDPGFLPEDFTTEKQVILEEIEMYNDRPEFLLFEALMEKRFAGHPLAARILGTRDSITALTLPAMRAYHAARYRPSNLLLAVAGRVAPDEVFAWADALPSIGDREATVVNRPLPLMRRGGANVIRPKDQLEHYIVAWPGPILADVRGRYVAAILGVLAGDDEGSRLAWALTHPGLAESASVGSMSFRDTGMVFASLSAIPDQFESAREILLTQMNLLATDPPRQDEFERARTKFTSRTILAAESPMGRMSGLGGDGIEGLPYYSLEEELRILLSITRDEVVTAAVLGEFESEASIGPVDWCRS